MQQLASTLILLFLGLPLLAYVANFLLPKRIHGLLLFFIVAFVGYVLIVGTAWAADVHLKARMDSFEGQNTPEAEAAREEWASDTGRTMAPILGIPMSSVWTGVNFAVLYFGEMAVRMIFGKRAVDEPVSMRTGPAIDDGNPYQSPPDS